jgi:DNA polymerase (family 10)
VAQTLPSNAQLAEQFELLADLLELDGADAFRLSAYRRAATRIRESAVPVAQLALDKKATRLSGIGATIEGKIVEYTETGDLAALAKLRDKLPTGLVEVMHVPGLGPKTARKLWVELGVRSAEDLRAAAEQGRLAEVQGLGPKTQEKVLASLAKPRKAIEQKTLLGRVLPAVDEAVEELRSHPAAVRVSETGSVRRRCETVRDLDIIATADDPAALTAHFVAQPWVAEVVAHGGTKATVLSHDGLRFDLRVVPPESYGNLLQHFSGSKAHNVAMREEAVTRGLSISEYGARTRRRIEVFTAATEEEPTGSSATAGSRPSSARTGGELQAAREGTLPEPSSWTKPSAATCTRTRPGRTAAHPSTKWPRRPKGSGAPTWRSATTRAASRATAGWSSRPRKSRRWAAGRRVCRSCAGSRSTSARTAHWTCPMTYSPPSTG